jgi:hypothetical protein
MARRLGSRAFLCFAFTACTLATIPGIFPSALIANQTSVPPIRVGLAVALVFDPRVTAAAEMAVEQLKLKSEIPA